MPQLPLLQRLLRLALEAIGATLAALADQAPAEVALGKATLALHAQSQNTTARC